MQFTRGSAFAFALVVGACGIHVVGELAPSSDGADAGVDHGGGGGGGVDHGGGDGDPGDGAGNGDSGAGDADAPFDAPPDVAAVCPTATCNGGCGVDGKTCLIDVTSQATVNCPPGFACQVRCSSASACDAMTINCAAAEPCTIVCSGLAGGACTSNVILNQNGASSFCIDCEGSAGNAACNSIGSGHCNALAPTCSKVCGPGGCGGSCALCATRSACP